MSKTSGRSAASLALFAALIGGSLATAALAQGNEDVSAKEAFESARELGTLDAWDAFIARYPNGFRADLARAYIKKLRAEGAVPAPPVQGEAPREAAEPAPPPAKPAPAVPVVAPEPPAEPKPKPPAPAAKATKPSAPAAVAAGPLPPTDPGKPAVARGAAYLGFPERFNRHYTDPAFKPTRIVFVSPAGGGDGASRQSPAAVPAALAAAKPGTRIVFLPGAYQGGFELTKEGSGTYEAPIVLYGERGPDGAIAVTVSCTKGTRQTCFNLEGADYVAVDGFELVGGRYGVRAVGAGYAASEHARGIAVLNVKGHDQDRDPLFSGQVDWAVWEGNVAYAAKKGDGHGIYLSNGSDWNIVRFNETFSNANSDFQVNADPNFTCKEVGIPFDDPRCDAFAGEGEGGQGASDYFLVDGNYFHHGNFNGANFTSVRRSVVRNNVFGPHGEKHNTSFWQETDNPKLGSSENQILHNLFLTTGRHAVKFEANSTRNLFANNVMVGVTLGGGKVAGNPSALLMEVDDTVGENIYRGNLYVSGKLEGREPGPEEKAIAEFSPAWFAKFPATLNHDANDFAPAAGSPLLGAGALQPEAPADRNGTARAGKVTLGPIERAATAPEPKREPSAKTTAPAPAAETEEAPAAEAQAAKEPAPPPAKPAVPKPEPKASAKVPAKPVKPAPTPAPVEEQAADEPTPEAAEEALPEEKPAPSGKAKPVKPKAESDEPPAKPDKPAPTAAEAAPASGGVPRAVTVARATTIPACTLFVDAAAKAGGNGTAQKPHKTIGAAATAAREGAVICVAEGAYPEQVKPGEKGFTLAGGFQSGSEFKVRDSAAHVSKAVGRGGSFISITDPGPKGKQLTVVDGFEISGYSQAILRDFYEPQRFDLTNNHIHDNTCAPGNLAGAGFALNNVTGTIRGNVIRNNTCARGGAGFTNDATNNTVSVENNRVENNAGIEPGAAHGGALYLFGKTLTVTGNEIVGNSVTQWGGGLYIGAFTPGNQPTTATMSWNVYRGNRAGDSGGGFFCDDGATCHSSHEIYQGNCGGNILVDGGSGGSGPTRATFDRITNVGALSPDCSAPGTGFFLDTYEGVAPDSYSISNALFWGNGKDIETACDKGCKQLKLAIDHSMLETKYGDGSIKVAFGAGMVAPADPLFLAPDTGDFHLQSAAGHWTPSGIAPGKATSPAIGKGNPKAASEAPERAGPRIELGAYGGSAEASYAR